MLSLRNMLPHHPAANVQWKAGMGTPNTTVTFTALYNINDLMLPGVDDYETYLSDLYGDFRTQRIDEYRPTP